jgi:hypothetical protein
MFFRPIRKKRSFRALGDQLSLERGRPPCTFLVAYGCPKNGGKFTNPFPA